MKTTREFGDFQTPPQLAGEVAALVARIGISPRAVLEPTCGKGAFIHAAATAFPEARAIFGVDINSDYVKAARSATVDQRVRVFEGNFFNLDWSTLLSQSNGPWLILGNPPWVTSSELSRLSSANLPRKENFQGLSGVEAITGKSNFDISEWMLLRYLDWLQEREMQIAVLCKVTVARKILASAWTKGIDLEESRIYSIDANEHFGVAVDACLFIVTRGSGTFSQTCSIFKSLDAREPSSTLSFVDKKLVGNQSDFRRGRHLLGVDCNYQWRSGIKHDCAKVMELRVSDGVLVNGFGAIVDVEGDFLYPMLKSSDVATATRKPRRMIVPQRFPGEDISQITSIAPKTWEYLVKHRDLLGNRGSSIYKNKGEFAIFGVGPYTFAPWKVAISGLYKNLNFTTVGPIDGRPVVFDDTVYFVPCYSDVVAIILTSLLSSVIMSNLLGSMVHREAKRPITVEILKQINLSKVATELGCLHEYTTHIAASDKPLSNLGGFGLFELA